MEKLSEISREEALKAENRKTPRIESSNSMIRIHDCFKRIALALSEHQISNADATNKYYELYHDATDRSANKSIWQAGISLTAGVIGGGAGIGGAAVGAKFGEGMGKLASAAGSMAAESLKSGTYLVQSGQTHNEAQRRMVESHHEGQKQRVSASDRTLNMITDTAVSLIRSEGERLSRALAR